jgi:regulator of replication initiation timing
MNRIPSSPVNTVVIALALVVWSAAPSVAQQASDGVHPATSTIADFDRHLDELTSKLDSMRQQLLESQSEMDELRREVHSLREQLAQRNQGQEAARDADALRASVAQLQDETEILQAEVKQHDQIKVETTSKYPVRINGAILFTSTLNSGSTDNIDVPIVALPTPARSPSGSLSATASQTMLGLDATGPHFWGASSRADIMMDFWGAASSNSYDGIFRLRTGHARLEWPNRSIGVALDQPMISPWQPTSWSMVGEPALAWSGNLWTWDPQLQYEEKKLLSHHLTLGVGLIGPQAPMVYLQSQPGGPSASEQSRQPGYEARLGSVWSHGDHPMNFGVGGYYSRQAYAYGRSVDAWAATADWNLVFSQIFQLSGEAYRGRAIGGLGGGTFKDYVTNIAEHYFHGLDDAGGWAQAKFTFSPSFEANVSTGLDNGFANDLRDSDQASASGWYANLARNQTVLANVVYRPRTYLLLSAEFRQINSRTVAGRVSQNNVLGLATGYIF